MAAATRVEVSGPRWKSYWAISSVPCAASMKSVSHCATVSAVWPPSVKVRSSMSGMVEALAAAEIGETCNFYRDGERAAVRCARLEAYLDTRGGARWLL